MNYRRLFLFVWVSALLLPCTLRADDNLYRIGSAEELESFAGMLNADNSGLNAVLTADIDYTGHERVVGENCWYTGTFDGQGHTITIDLSTSTDNYGFFKSIGETGTVKNLVLAGTLATSGKNAGAFSGICSGRITNCISRVTIESSHYGDSGHGGFVGMTANNAYITNCISAGRFLSDASTHCGGFVGWKGWGTTIIENCLEIMDVNLPTTDGCHAFGRGGYDGGNNYYLTDMGSNGAATLVTEDELADGAVCFKLNGDQSAINFYQTLGQDLYPVPFATSKRVYASGTFNCDGVTPVGEATYSNESGDVTILDHSYQDGVCQECGHVDMGYCSQEDGFYLVGNGSQLNWITHVVTNLNQDVNVRLTDDIDYTAYQDVIAYDTWYTGTFDGQGHTITIDLTGDRDYMGLFFRLGGAAVIENLTVDGTLTTKGKNAGGLCGWDSGTIRNCTSRVTINALFDGDCGHGGFAGFTFDNAYFYDCLSQARFEGESAVNCGGYVGWHGWGTTWVENCLEIMEVELPTAEGCSPFVRGGYTGRNNYCLSDLGDKAATLLQPGQMAGGEACYRLNGDQKDIPMSIENVLPADEAVDGENCNLTGKSPDYEIADDEGQALGYAIGGALGLANAAGAGRSVACIAARAEDGVLRVGVRHEATGSGSDWTALANVSLTYLGTPEEAAGRLGEVLDGQVNRARTLLDYVFSDGADYREFPNFMQLLRDELRAEIDEASAATDGEARYELIGRFSKTFADIYASKQAYVSMLDMMEELTIVAEAMYPDNISEEDFQAVLDVAEWAWDGYANGTISTDEALSLDCLKDVAIAPVVEDGVYQIGNYGQMLYFVNKVNSGKDAADARLTRDVDFSGNNEQIAKGGFYNGTFDGQGHHLTIRMDGTSDAMGLFFRIGDAGTVRNLVIDGTVTTSGKNAGGLCGWSAGTISHCVSLVTIASTHGGDSGHGGFVGQTFNNGTIEYCLSAGRFLSDYSTNCGGFVGWNGWGSTNISHCLQIMDVELPSVSGSHAIGRGGYTGTNNYYLTDLDGHGDAVVITQEQLGSGHVCYCLNGDQTDLNWFQTLGQDQYPVPFDTHLRVVLEDDGTYKNADSEDGVQLTQTSAEGDGRDSVYDLFGRKVGKAASRGIYIVNGKKVIMGR